MIESMIPAAIKDFDYYRHKLPIWLQNSTCFVQHFKIWFDIFVGDRQVSGTSTVNDVIENLLNIFDDNYLTYIVSFEGSNADVENFDYGDASDILDKIGALFGVTRRFNLTYDVEGVETTTTFSLSNYTFLTLIKAQIVKNYCEGSQQQIQQYYQSCGLPILVTTDDNTTCSLVLSLASLPQMTQTDQDDIIALFYSGLLTIDCVGVSYTYLVVGDIQSLLIWDRANWADEGIDGGVWAV